MTPAEQKIDSLWRGTLDLEQGAKLVNFVKLARYMLTEFQEQSSQLAVHSEATDHLLELDDIGKMLSTSMLEIIAKLPKEAVPGEFAMEIARNGDEIAKLVQEKQAIETARKNLLESRTSYEQAVAELNQLKQTIATIEQLQTACSEQAISEAFEKAIQQQQSVGALLTNSCAEMERQSRLQLEILQRRSLEDSLILQSIAGISAITKPHVPSNFENIAQYLADATKTLGLVESTLKKMLES